MKNKYAHRYQHPQEPQTREFQRIDTFELCQLPPNLPESLANNLISSQINGRQSLFPLHLEEKIK